MRRVLGIIRYWKAALIISALFLCFQVTGYAADVTLQWGANTEPDLAGYKIYYDTGSGEPYTPDVADYADQGSSPITVPIGDLGDPNNPEYTLTGLSDSEIYLFVVTAYDTEGLESDYSDEVNILSVASITSATADGYYKAGDTVNITINFSKAVTLAGGNLIVTLDTGGTAVIGPFDSQTITSGTYTVKPGDNSGDLNATSLTLDPPTATLRNAWSLDCDLSLPTGSNLAYNNDIVIDAIPPNAPMVSGTTPTNDTTPSWSWSSGGGGNGTYRYKLHNSNLSSGATQTVTTSYTPGSALSEGSHALYVQEWDDAGNWSSPGSFTIVIDATEPGAPLITTDGGNGPGSDYTTTDSSIILAGPVQRILLLSMSTALLME